MIQVKISNLVIQLLFRYT